MRRWMLVLGCTGSSACVAEGQQELVVPLSVAGTAIEAPIIGRDDVEIVLDEARLAFGPLYLCAGTQAGELCDTARLEWLDGVIVDALDPEPDAAGELSGVSGNVRSWMYDLGYTSLLTREQPLRLPAAQALGASVRLSGTAWVEGVAIPFETKIVIQQQEDTEVGVPVVRSSPADRIDHDVEPGEAGMLVRFDPSYWVSDIDFVSLRADDTCAPDGPGLVCAGDLEQTCAPDGAVVQSRDCTELGELCIVERGCLPGVELAEGEQAQRSIHTQIIAGPSPRFEWGVAP